MLGERLARTIRLGRTIADRLHHRPRPTRLPRAKCRPSPLVRHPLPRPIAGGRDRRAPPARGRGRHALFRDAQAKSVSVILTSRSPHRPDTDRGTGTGRFRDGGRNILFEGPPRRRQDPPSDRLGAGLLLVQVICQRYDKQAATIITYNKTFIDGAMSAPATPSWPWLLDRLLHRATVVNIKGESYRMTKKRLAGLFHRSGRPDRRPTKGGPRSKTK